MELRHDEIEVVSTTTSIFHDFLNNDNNRSCFITKISGIPEIDKQKYKLQSKLFQLWISALMKSACLSKSSLNKKILQILGMENRSEFGLPLCHFRKKIEIKRFVLSLFKPVHTISDLINHCALYYVLLFRISTPSNSSILTIWFNLVSSM